MRSRFRFFGLSVFCVFALGCASALDFFSGNRSEGEWAAQPPVPADDELLRFSDNPNIGTYHERRYRRVNRQGLEDENDLGSRAGSLWLPEGPSAYLFSQNKIYKEGDLLNIKVEGAAKNQVQTKIDVIKELLDRLEIVPAPDINTTSGPALAQSGEGLRTPAGLTPSGDPNLGDATNRVRGAQEAPPVSIELVPTRVPTRVTERLSDGTYRLKGQQSFMIGKREFRVIVTGLVRPEDFVEEGMSSEKLLDPQWDVVSPRKVVQ